MTCSKCGQVTQQISAGIVHYIPCSCPVDQEAFNKRMEYLRERLNQAWKAANNGKETPC